MQAPMQAHAYPPPSSKAPGSRPGTVTAAAIITWISTGLMLILSAIGILAVLAARSDLMSTLNEDPDFRSMDLTEGQVIAAVVVTLGVTAVWSLVSAILAVFVYRGANWARIVLTVSASMVVGVSLLMIVTGVSAITLLAAGVVIVLLFVGGANAWFTGRKPGSGPGDTHPPVW
jgi:hypothetical protein